MVRVHAVLLLYHGRCSGCRRLVQVGALSLASAVADRAAVLVRFYVSLPKNTEIRLVGFHRRDSLLVIPMRPSGTEGWNEDKLAELVSAIR